MALFSETWNATFEGQPPDSEGAKLGADRIRDLRVAVRERLVVDHSWAGDANDGLHKQASLIPLGVKPTLATTLGAVYAKVIGAFTELFYEDSAGVEIQLTSAGGAASSSLVTDTAADVVLVVGDRGKTYNLTGAIAKTFTLPASATLGNGWWVDVISNATAELTILAAGADLIDAVTRVLCANGEGFRVIYKGGAAFITRGRTRAGCVRMYPGAIPAGWKDCIGGTFVALDYPELNTYLGGNTLPDSRGRSPLGVGTGAGLSARALLATGGAETHVLVPAEIPAHVHSTPSVITASRGDGASATATSGSTNSGSAGGDGAHNTMHPFIAFNIAIKA